MATRPLRRLLPGMISLLSGCATTRDFYDPQQRITDATAYALTNREVRVDTGLLGTGVQDLGANIDVAVGFGRGPRRGALGAGPATPPCRA